MTKHVVTLVIGILLFGIGCGYCTFEILDYDYVNETNPNVLVETETKEYPIGFNNRYEIDVKDGIVRLEIDNSLLDTMYITTSYPSDYTVLTHKHYTEHHGKDDLIYKFHRTESIKDMKDIFDILVEDVKHKHFYNYPRTFVPVVEVHVSKQNLKYIDMDEDDIDIWDD